MAQKSLFQFAMASRGDYHGYRFKIEVTFKGLKMGSFCYRFWTKAMPKMNKKPSSI